RVKLTRGLYTVDDGPIGYADGVNVRTDNPLGAIVADAALTTAFALHELDFRAVPAETAYDACSPVPGNYPGTCGDIGWYYCNQYSQCQTVYDTCVGYSYDFCCNDPYYFYSYDCDPYVCGGPYEYTYQCNPHPGNCTLHQSVYYDNSVCDCTNRIFDRQCGLP